MLILLLVFLLACQQPEDTGVWSFLVDPSCDGMGSVRLTLDEIDQGRYELGNSGQHVFHLSVGTHSGRAQELQGRLREFPLRSGDVRSDRPVTYLLRCPHG